MSVTSERSSYGFAAVVTPLRDLDKWIRHRVRSYHWKQWGRRGYRELRKRGISARLAWNTAKSVHGPWRLSRFCTGDCLTRVLLRGVGAAFFGRGLNHLLNPPNRCIRDPYVRWCGRSGVARSRPISIRVTVDKEKHDG